MGRENKCELTPRQESCIPICRNREDHGYETEPGAVRLTPAIIGEIFTIVPLSFERAVEEEIYDAHGDVINDLRCLREIRKPIVV
jgi:hypothetical protein